MKKLFCMAIGVCLFWPVSSEAVSLPGKPTAELCNYCTDSGKKLIAINTANYVGQTIYVVDDGAEIIINEYKALGTVDQLDVELQRTHGPSSNLALMLKKAKRDIEQARQNMEYAFEGIELPGNFPWPSAFTALQAQRDAVLDVQSYLNTTASLKQNLDIIDVSIEQLKVNFGVGFKLLSTALSISQTIRVKFADGSSFEFEVFLTKDILKTSSRIKLGLKLVQALDRQNQKIPFSMYALGLYNGGRLLTEGNIGNLNAFVQYAESLGFVKILIDNRQDVPEGSVKITDCKIKQGQDGPEILCNSENG